jgi:large subunit ribosomal protein L32
MPNPKHKHSKTRRDKRRTHDALSAPALSRCPQCQESRMPHRICPHCGFYGGRQVIETKERA